MNHEQDLKLKIGGILKELRIKRGMTQVQLAKITGYSERQIQRFESSDRNISEDAIVTLSNFYNFDIAKYFEVITTFKNPEDYEDYRNLYIQLENSNCTEVKRLSDKLRHKEVFQKGDKRILLLYCDAFILAKLDHQYSESIELCNELLDKLKCDDYIESLKTSIQRKTFYSIMLLLLFNYNHLNKRDLYKELVIRLHKHFEELIFSTAFPISSDMYNMNKYFLATKNYLAKMYLNEENYELALSTIDDAIELSNTRRVTTFLPNVLLTKAEICYKMNDIDSSRKFFSYYKGICDVRHCSANYKAIEKDFKEKYHLLFT